MTATTRTLGRVPFPRIWPLRPADLLALAAGNGALVVGMWLRHGGLDQLSDVSGTITALGQVTALLGTYLALIQIVLMSRSPWLDQLFGMERISVWHRWIGFSVLWLLVGHAVFSMVGYAAGDGRSVLGEAWTLLTTYPYVLMATVALGLLVMVAVTSVRLAQRRFAYETWYGLHLYAYLAIALGFGHEVAVGTDFTDDPLARAYWIGLYLIVAALVLAFRIGQPILTSLRHRLRVAAVVREGPNVASVYVSGRRLDQLAVRAGQYFIWRFLAGDGWWRPHPFSLSAAPNGEYLRLTVKDLGDDSRRLLSLRPGTAVFAEGPYGAMTGARRRRARVLLIAGGIGVTPLRALLEELPAGGSSLAMIYRASSWNDVVLRDEIDQIARERGITVHYVIGQRGSPHQPRDPLDARSLARMIPDVRHRDVYVCGPIPMMDELRRTLRQLRVADGQVHMERFSY